MTIIFLTLAVSSALAFGLPWRWVRYLILMYGLGIILFWLLLPPVHTTDQDFGYLIGMAILVSLTVAVGLPLLGRLCWAIHKGSCDFSIQTNADEIIAIGVGLVLSILGFVILSFITAGTPMSVSHMIALMIAVMAWQKHNPVSRSFSAGFVMLILYSLSYPLIVTHAARQVAGQASYQIAMPHRTPSASLTFLSMPKFPHPWVHFMKDGQPVNIGWSYRQHAFLPVRH